MIRYALTCDRGHGFDAWFGSSDTYDEQAEALAIVCPDCGSVAVRKAPMAPNILKGARAPGAPAREATPPDAGKGKQTYGLLRELRAHLKAHAEDVGPQFAEEARKMHFGETPARSIYGEASVEEARELADDGIPVFPLPQLPEDKN
jgi:hypothetical protein